MSALETPRVVSHSPRPVDLGAIDNALKLLWKPPGEPPDVPVTPTRACMSNLLIFCATGCDAGAVTDELDAIVRVQPSRILLLTGLTEVPGAQIDAQISAHCHLGGDGHHICSEQITIKATRDAIFRLPSTARPLLIGDLPTSLWWASDVPPPLGGDVFSELRAMADQVIYSSDRWPEPVLGTIATAAWSSGTAPGRLSIADLAWLRLKPWRRLASQTLDPALLPGAVERINRIDVEHGPHGLPEAWLLAGWYASRLGWASVAGVVRAGEETVWSFRSAHGPVQVRFHRRAEGDSGVQRLVVAWNAVDGPATVTFAPAEGGRLVATSPVLGNEPRTLVLPSESRAALIAAELQDLGPNPIFRAALDVSRTMAESLGS